MGRKPRGVRLDSGDVAADSKWIRKRLDQVGWKDVIIFASGDLDEDRIASLLAEGACIDGFGVGTALVTSSDSPTLGVIYKLVEIEFNGEVRSAAKFSSAKVTYPGKKQVYRFSENRRAFRGRYHRPRRRRFHGRGTAARACDGSRQTHCASHGSFRCARAMPRPEISPSGAIAQFGGRSAALPREP